MFLTVDQSILKRSDQTLQDKENRNADKSIQRTLEDIAERIAPKRECGLVRKLVMFGAASFAAQKGCAAAPRKALIRVLCQRVPVIMVPEHYTSISCPGCGRETKK